MKIAGRADTQMGTGRPQSVKASQFAAAADRDRSHFRLLVRCCAAATVAQAATTTLQPLLPLPLLCQGRCQGGIRRAVAMQPLQALPHLGLRRGGDGHEVCATAAAAEGPLAVSPQGRRPCQAVAAVPAAAAACSPQWQLRQPPSNSSVLRAPAAASCPSCLFHTRQLGNQAAAASVIPCPHLQLKQLAVVHAEAPHRIRQPEQVPARRKAEGALLL